MTDCATLHAKYISVLRANLCTVETTKEKLQLQHAPVWQEIVSLLQAADDAVLQQFLNEVFAAFDQEFPALPEGATKRPTPKTVARMRRKLDTVVQYAAERSACADWIACRIQAPYSTFEDVKKNIAHTLGEDVAVVWRSDDPGAESKKDIVVFGYAFRKGGNCMMEIQIIEPVANWVFAMNSKSKHENMPDYPTFKESKPFYGALKKVIVEGAGKDVMPNDGNVRHYYETVREDGGHPLNYGELDKFQELVNQVFSRN